MPEPGTENETIEMTSSPRRWLWKLVAVSFLILVGVGLSFAFYIGALGENFREVSAGNCYRSGQMSTESLQEHIRTLKVACVVNLRGMCKETWYDNEIKLCENNHVAHADFKIDPVRLPRPEVLHEMIQCFKQNPRPLLLHCRNGCDRTGLAATLYEIVVDKKGVRDAMAVQLSWRNGHIRSSKNDAAERFFELYEKNGGGKNIEDWIDNGYPAIYTSIGPYGSESK